MSLCRNPHPVARYAAQMFNVHEGMVLESLLDLSAKATAKHVSCNEMERHNLQLYDDILKNVAYWACPQDSDLIKATALSDDKTWRLGEDFIAENKVRDMLQVGFMVAAKVDRCNVSFTFEKQQIRSTLCYSCTDKLWCSHIIAAVLYRIRNSTTLPVHGPVTETLSLLNRDQLQKVIQYAIEDDPAGVLGKVFRRIDQIRDAKSEINEGPCLPDPTFGLGSDETPTWDLTIHDLSRSFITACQDAVYDFPCSLEESKIRDSLCYKRFMHKVIDLVQVNQIEAAGQIVITLLTEATNVALDNPENTTKRYKCLLRAIETMCSLYILEFSGQYRSDLIVLCQNLNKTLQLDCSHSNWADLPSISQLFPFESAVEPGMMEAKQTSLFYEPLCVSIVPDPNKEFRDLVEGNVQPVYSRYNEPLPLMILRFQSLRLWNTSERSQRKVLSLGSTILRKLLRETRELTVLKELDITKPEGGTHSEHSEKRKARDNVITGLTFKKRKLFSEPLDLRLIPNAEAENMDNSSEAEPPSINKLGCVLTDVMELLNGAPRLSSVKKSETDERYAAIRLRSVTETLDKPTQDSEVGILSKETLSFCIGNICYCMYQINDLHIYLSEADIETLALATLRALELSRYRIDSDKRSEISLEEHSALQSLEQRLFDCYTYHVDKIAPYFVAGLEMIYIKNLCLCNTGQVCFFKNNVPLPLIAFLVKRQLQHPEYSREDKRQALNLCLYTLCHSNTPFSYYEPLSYTDNYNEYCELYNRWLKAFEDIVTQCLDNIKDLPYRNFCDMPERYFYLKKLLNHYIKVQDARALYCLWDGVRKCPLEVLLDDTTTAVLLLDFLLNCIVFHNYKSTFGCYIKEFRQMMESICEKLGSEFTRHVLPSWEELAKFYYSHELESLMDKIKATLEYPLRDNMFKSFMGYFSGAFEHTVDSCLLLKLFIEDAESLGKIYEVIYLNSDYFSSSALLKVAEMSIEQNIKGLIDQSEKLFSNFAEKVIILALKRTGQENKSVKPAMSSYSGKGNNCTIFSKIPDPHIQWVFLTLQNGATETIANYQQLYSLIIQIRETYADDLSTILSLMSSVENQPLLFEKCKLTFGERIIELASNALLQAADSLMPRYYKPFKADLDKVWEFFTKYVVDGYEAFKVLLNDIQRKLKRRKRLVADLKSAYDL